MRRAIPFVVLAAIVLLLAQGCPLRDSANEKVVEKVKERHADASWMKHVTDWGTTLGISVETDYPPADVASYARAYEICRVVMAEYAPGANDLPSLRIYGSEVTKEVKVDGSTSTKRRNSVMATSTGANDYRCGITPPTDLRDKAKSLKLRIHTR